MSFSAATVDIGASATPIAFGESGSRQGINYVFTNVGLTELRLGGSDVNMTDKGWPLPAGASVPITVNGPDTLYARAAVSGSLSYLKQDD